MKRIRHLILGLCMMTLQHHLVEGQQQVSITEARKAAVQTLNLRQNRNSYSEAKVKKVNTLKNRAENTLMYEVIFDDDQGVLLSGSKACLPVLGYYECEDGGSVFDEDAPCGLKTMLYEYEMQIESCFQNDTVRLYYHNEWQDLQQETNSFQKSAQTVTKAAGSPPTQIIVEPLLKSRWGQSSPNKRDTSNPGDCDAYNYYAPKGDCSNCRIKKLAGCGPVAMAQIMYFWKYPVYSIFTGAMNYDWCNMADSLDTSSPNYINERNAIAHLIKDCGDALGLANNDYGCNVTNVNPQKTEDAFKNLEYNDNADFQRRIWYSTSTWIGRIKGQLDQGRPVL